MVFAVIADIPVEANITLLGVPLTLNGTTLAAICIGLIATPLKNKSVVVKDATKPPLSKLIAADAPVATLPAVRTAVKLSAATTGGYAAPLMVVKATSFNPVIERPPAALPAVRQQLNHQQEQQEDTLNHPPAAANKSGGYSNVLICFI
jgi:hypothetical protein